MSYKMPSVWINFTIIELWLYKGNLGGENAVKLQMAWDFKAWQLKVYETSDAFFKQWHLKFSTIILFQPYSLWINKMHTFQWKNT